MQAVRVRCSRCGWDVDGLCDEMATAGYYRVNVGPWEKYGRPGEEFLCDACMWSDHQYCHDYGVSEIEGHVMHLQRRWPQAYWLRPVNDQTRGTVVVLDVLLPSGWNKERTEVRFVLPAGFPLSMPPSSFWCDGDLRLANGGMPALTNLLKMPGEDEPRLWFLHALRAWHPGKDTIVTYFYTVRLRLQKAR
jgi:hypothetical protein